MTGTGSVVAFTIPEKGHLHRMLPVVAGLCAAGIPVHFFASEAARAEVERTGARFIDLYARRPVDEADSLSRPAPIRYVSFAGRHGEAVAAEAAALQPRLVLHDTFAVIGRAVASRLNLPRVDVRAGHDMEPVSTLDTLRRRVPIIVSDSCKSAVETLRDRFGIADISPFSYFIDTDADLNLYSEPPEFLPPGRREPYEPLEFFGSYWPGRETGPAVDETPFGPGAADARLRIYVSFGTVIWSYFEREALAALEALVGALAGRPDVRVLISLGGRPVTGAAAGLRRPNIRVEPYVDQIRVLQDASVYVTHHGLNSTHEATFHGVPMISRPFFGDQFALAARCQELGLAVPLTPVPGAPATMGDAGRAVAAIEAGGEALRARMATAQGWERSVIDRREAVIRRVAGLLRSGADGAPALSRPRRRKTPLSTASLT